MVGTNGECGLFVKGHGDGEIYNSDFGMAFAILLEPERIPYAQGAEDVFDYLCSSGI